MSDLTPETLKTFASDSSIERHPELAWNTLMILRSQAMLHVTAWEADRKRLQAMRLAAEQCDVAMDGASVHGLPQQLPKPYRQQWTEAHTALRAAIAEQA